MSFSLLGAAFGFALYFHGFNGGLALLNATFHQVLLIAFLWWRDIIREATFEGQHTAKVSRGLRYGMILFIVSEMMFFFAFFWAFFYFSLNASIALGGVWPPKFFIILNPLEIPLLNTAILLTSGASITWAHHAIIWGSKYEAFVALGITILLAIFFTGLQAFEYINAPFSISDSVYGSIFYLTTGFHGFHVVVGTCFLIVCLIRLFLNHFSREQHFGFEAAAWYWHFVDVVWLFLYMSIYLWGSF
jgi:cytochrome c oxidase subunit 3